MRLPVVALKSGLVLELLHNGACRTNNEETKHVEIEHVVLATEYLAVSVLHILHNQDIFTIFVLKCQIRLFSVELSFEASWITDKLRKVVTCC